MVSAYIRVFRILHVYTSARLWMSGQIFIFNAKKHTHIYTYSFFYYLLISFLLFLAPSLFVGCSTSNCKAHGATIQVARWRNRRRHNGCCWWAVTVSYFFIYEITHILCFTLEHSNIIMIYSLPDISYLLSDFSPCFNSISILYPCVHGLKSIFSYAHCCQCWRVRFWTRLKPSSTGDYTPSESLMGKLGFAHRIHFSTASSRQLLITPIYTHSHILFLKIWHGCPCSFQALGWNIWKIRCWPQQYRASNWSCHDQPWLQDVCLGIEINRNCAKELHCLLERYSH